MTSNLKHLLGWFSYAFASEVFVTVSLTLFLPICLEQFARDNGVCDDAGQCTVRLGWLAVDTASFSLYVYSISVALQALTVISMGSLADRPAIRKPLLLAFALAGASAAFLFLFLSSSSPLWILSALLATCANVGFGASVVAMNAYLPQLARESPEVVRAYNALADDQDSSAPLLGSDSTTPQLDDTSPAHKAYVSALSRATSRISAQGIASGYIAGIFMLLLTLIPVTRLHGSTFSLRLAIGLSGVWWMLFSIPAALWLPGPSSSSDDSLKRPLRITDEVVAAWKRLGVMLHWSQVRRLQHTFRFLAAWFLLSDGLTTISSVAILFGKTVLHMDSSALVLIGAISPACGILGSLTFPMLQRRFGWSNLGVLVRLVLAVSLVPAYGCLGFVPFVKRLHIGGLTTPGEMYGLAVIFGFAYGAFQSYARASYAELIPPGEEARWYGLFSITDKSSSFIGPLIVGVISDSTGNIRYAFFFLIGMIWLAVPVLMSVDVERGRVDAQTYSVERVGGAAVAEAAEEDANAEHAMLCDE